MKSTLAGEKMIRPIFLIGTTCFWLASMSQLIHREFFELSPLKTAYEVLPILDGSLREEYRGIYLGGNLIGFTNTALEKESPEKEPSPDAEPQPGRSGQKDEENRTGFELRQNTYMTFLFLGEEREMLVRSKALLDERLELQAFELKITSGEYGTDMKGRVLDDQMELHIESKGAPPVIKNIPVRRPLFFSESLPMIWTPENLKPGKRGTLRIWNPLLLGFEEIDFHVGPSERTLVHAEEVEAIKVTLNEKGVETHYWCTPEGVVLKYESPTGLLMVKQDAWRIFDTLRENRGALTDLPNLYSIPANRELPAAEKIKSLTVKIRTPEGETLRTIQRETFAGVEDLPRIRPEDPSLAPYLGSDSFIQSDAPEILKKASELAGHEINILPAAAKLVEGVHQLMTPTPTVSIPSALQVLTVRKGDCNEYTVLFAALARSLGIPVKTVAGLVYQNGRFFYHAWPEVYAGRWIAVDPTFGQVPADAAHIALVEGSLEDQINLIQKIGKISVEIVNAEVV